MTEYEQKLYDVIADWWDEINPPPVDRDGERNKILAIIHLVKSISKLEETMTGTDEELPQGYPTRSPIGL